MTNGPELDTGAAAYTSAADLHDTGLDGLPNRTTRIAQLPPAGLPVQTPVLLLGALLYSDARTVSTVAEVVHPDDLDTISQGHVYEVLRDNAARGRVGPQVALDELTRRGLHTADVQRTLTDAVTSGAIAEQAPMLAGAVLAVSFRRRADSYAEAVSSMAATGSEAELWHAIKSGGAALRRVADRLARARGGDL